MKAVKIIGWGAVCVTGIIILLLAISEFLVWRMHDYAMNYATIQTCIETGGSWDYEDSTCNK